MIAGMVPDAFPLDAFQAGAGTPIHIAAAHGLLDRQTVARLFERGALTGPGVIDVALRRRVQTAPAYREFHTLRGL